MKQILNETRMELRLDRCRLMRNSFSDVDQCRKRESLLYVIRWIFYPGPKTLTKIDLKNGL